jgi:hypothetical protein
MNIDENSIDENRLLIALKRLAESADGYIDDGSWCDALTQDIADAHKLIDQILEARNFEKSKGETK